jgi:tetratricopeptide (TPR) repeat protein
MQRDHRATHDYESFDLLVGASTPGAYAVTVIQSPAGEAAAICHLDPEDFSLQEALAALRSKDVDRAFLEQLGHYLFEELFAGEVAMLYRTSLGMVRSQGRHLRIHLRIESPPLAVLPWEYLFDAEEDRFLALSAETVIVRYIPMRLPIRSLKVTPPLRILAVFASPTDHVPLDVAGEKERLQQALEGSIRAGQIQLEILEKSQMATISEAMRTFQPHVFHFVGHGLYANEEAYLVLEDAQGAGTIVDERTFRELFTDSRETRLVVLNACETGVTSAVQPVVGMAPRLLQRQISAVVAMQAEILDKAALVLGHVFYRSLALGFPVDAAVAGARRAIFLEFGQDRGDWGIPVLFMRAQDGQLFDISEPQQPQAVQIPPPPRPVQLPEPADFVGREVELNYFMQKLQGNNIVVISGMAGVGKTALAAVLSRRLAEESRIFWHHFHQGEGVDAIVWKLAGWLAWQGRDDLWRMLQSAKQHGGQPPPPETLFDYLLHLLAGHDYLIFLDDLHYVDTDPLIEHLMERLRTSVQQGKLSIIITTRRLPPFILTMEFQPLNGLTEADTQHLLSKQNIFLPVHQVTFLHHTTGGNAQLLNLAATLVQHTGDATDLIERLDKAEDIEQYLLVEIDAGLEENQRAVMGAVAVLLGYPSTRDAVEVVLDSTQGLQRTLTELSRRHLLVTGDSANGRTYSQHAMVQTFYYHFLSRRQRQTMHRRAGEYYEFEEVDLLKAARHYSQAGEHEHAIALVVANVTVLINQGEARTLYHLVVDLAKHQLSADMDLQLLEARGDIEYLLGDLKQAVQTYTASAAKASDAITQARQWRKLGEVQARLGEYQEALATFGKGRELLRTVGYAPTEDALLAVGISTVLLNQGRYDDAQMQANAMIEALDQHNISQPTADLHDVLGKVYYFRGDFNASLIHFQSALALRQRQQDQRSILKSYSNLAIIYGDQNRYNESVKANKAALEIAEQIGDLVAISILYRNIAADYAEMDQFDHALEFNLRSLVLAENMSNAQSVAYVHHNLGDVYQHIGDFEQAGQHLLRAAELAEKLGEQHILIGARRQLADVYLRQGMIEEALFECLQALALVEEAGLQYWRPQILSSLGEIQRRLQQWPQARATFEEAVQLLRNSGASIELAMVLFNWSQLEEYTGNLTEAYKLCYEAQQLVNQRETDRLSEEITIHIAHLSALITSRGAT